MAELTPRFHWVLPEPHPLSDETIADARRRGLSARALRVLSRRGPVDPRSLASRFDPPELALNDPRLLPDAAKALARIHAARAAGERVMVFGDFDADGLTGLAILTSALRRLGLDVLPYVPDRTAEGHGMSPQAVQAAVAGGCRLIVTADTGSTSHAEIALAARHGIDVLITDHHALPRTPPDAVAVINPRRPDSPYPDDRLSGSGVAFKVAQLLLSEAADDLADLAAIGSIADVVPLEGENRAIVRLGLARLSAEPRPGLAALIAAARLDPERLDAEDIGFGLAPRINAMGRVGDPSVAAELLLATDDATSGRLAQRLEAANVERRALMAAALADARTAALTESDAPFVTVVGDWPVGVIGLVAGRIAEETGRPSLVVSRAVDPWRGSARSAGGFDLAAAFMACDDLLERHGGHPAAAGCHVQASAMPEVRRRLRELARRAGPGLDRRPTLDIDLVQSALATDHVLLRELAALDDGVERPPLVGVAGLAVARTRPANGGHTLMILRRGVDVVDGICFGRSDLGEAGLEGQRVDVVARLGIRSFAGIASLELDIRDVAPAGTLRGMRVRTPLAPDGLGAAGSAVGPAVTGAPQAVGTR
jgi:single-stranded-DNA-specific exonuclease